MQATADSTKMDCVWSNWKSQGILFISVVHACGAHGNPGPGISHCASFHLWDLCMLYTQELSVGGSKLVMSKIRVDGVWFFVFVFYLSHLKKKKKESPTPTPLFSGCQATVLNASLASSWSSFGFRSTSSTCLISSYSRS